MVVLYCGLWLLFGAVWKTSSLSPAAVVARLACSRLGDPVDSLKPCPLHSASFLKERYRDRQHQEGFTCCDDLLGGGSRFHLSHKLHREPSRPVCVRVCVKLKKTLPLQMVERWRAH